MPMNLYDDRARGFFSAPFTMARFDTQPEDHLPAWREFWPIRNIEDPDFPV